ncbi:MAG: acyltransferase [Bryocella sp.]
MTHSLPVTGNTEHTKPENRKFYPALDGLRAIAFLMVFFEHYLSLPWGWAGVNIFFVLSGFLITGILFDTKESPHRIRNFYVRRTLRIFPLYYGVIAIILLLSPVAHWHWSSLWIGWPLYLGNFWRFLSPTSAVYGSTLQLAADAQLYSSKFPHSPFFFGHFWSLCVEEQFYLLWPWIVFRARRRKTLLWICGIATLLIPLARVAAQHLAPHWMLHAELLYRFTPFQADSLLLGGWAALMWRGPHREALLRWSRVVAIAMAMVAAVYYFATIRGVNFAEAHSFIGYQYPVWIYTVGITFVNVLAASVIVCLLSPSRWLAMAFGNRPMRWLGRISYGAYVLHDIPQMAYGILASRFRHHWHLSAADAVVIYVVLGLGSTILLAWLSFRFYESRFLNLKERWTVR